MLVQPPPLHVMVSYQHAFHLSTHAVNPSLFFDHWRGGMLTGFTMLIGDDLVPTQNGAITTLAFVIGLVSCWCALILVEQILYAANKGERYWPWAIAMGIIQGGPGVWALHLIAMSALSWPTQVSLSFNPGYAIASLVVSIALNLAAYYAALYGWLRNKQQDELSPSTQTSAVVKNGAAAAARRYDVIVARTGSTAGGSAPAQPSSNGEYTPAADIMDEPEAMKSGGSRLRHRVRELSRDRSVLGQIKIIPYRINLWFIGSAALLSATTVLSHYLITLSLPAAYGVQGWTGSYLLFLLFGRFLFLTQVKCRLLTLCTMLHP
jgi:hypothetical protein